MERPAKVGAGVAAWVRTNLRPGRLVPTLTAGVVIGLVEVVLVASFAAVIFGGRGAVNLPPAIGFNLFAAVAVMTVIALGSSLPGMVGSVQDSTAVLLALLSVSIATERSLELGYTVEQTQALSQTFLTVIAAIVIASALTGVFFLVLGIFKLGHLVRYVPYPVIGGFLAGTGWLLFKGGIGVLASRSLTLAEIEIFARPGMVLRWVPGLLFALVLLLLVRQFRHFLTIPATLVAGVALFYLVLWATGTTVEAAETRGFLLGPFPPGGGLFDPAVGEAFSYADWGAIFGQILNILAVLLVAVLALLINATGIELIADRDTDVNRELKVAGVANVAAGAGGGIVGFQALSLTALARRTGGATRLVGLVAAGVCLLAMVYGAQALSLFPRPVLGGMVVFLGLSFLVEWVIEARSKLLRRDYLVVLLILVAVAFLGFLPGVVVGLLLATLLFVVDYSRLNMVKDEVAGSLYRSKVDRDPEHLEILRSEGDRIHVMILQGIVFFGTAHSLLERIRNRAQAPDLPRLEYLVMDFRRVSTMDTSAVLAFAKVHALAEARDFTLVLSGLSDGVRRQLEQGGFAVAEPRVRTIGELDRAVEWVEDRILEAEAASAPRRARPLAALLRKGFGRSVDPRKLMEYLEPLNVEAGEELIRQGDPPEDLYFLESGRLTAQLVRPNGETVRLQAMGPGTVVGEVTMYLGTVRTASVVTDEPSTVHRLTRRKFEEMERRDPELAAAVHRLFAGLLADRLSQALRTMDALLD